MKIAFTFTQTAKWKKMWKSSWNYAWHEFGRLSNNNFRAFCFVNTWNKIWGNYYFQQITARFFVGHGSSVPELFVCTWTLCAFIYACTSNSTKLIFIWNFMFILLCLRLHTTDVSWELLILLKLVYWINSTVDFAPIVLIECCCLWF